MKSLTAFLVFISLMVLVPTSGEAQFRQSNNEEKSDDFNFWRDKLWYGGAVGLGFNATSYYSVFNFGLYPMVGYKIGKTPFSVGPRFGANYTSLKGDGTDGQVHTAHLWNFSAGAFARVKLFEQFFIHTEYESAWEETAYLSNYYITINPSTGKPLTETIRRNNIYLGAGYNPGGYEFSILYNFNTPEDSYEQPYVVRGGFTIFF